MSFFISKSGLGKIVAILIAVILVGGSFGLGYIATRQPATPTASPMPTVNFRGGNSIVQSSDGGYVIAGVTGPDVYLDTPNVYLIKTDSSGNMVWNRTCGEGGVGFSVVQTSDRGYVIAGYKSVELGASWRGNDVYLLKLTPLEICSGTKPTAMALGFLLFNHLIADT